VSGSLLATPIVINQPQSAILGVGKVEKRPVVIEAGDEEKVTVRPKCYVTLTIDRDEMRRLLEAKGAKVSGSVSAKTHFVVAGEGGGSKRDKAEKLGVPVIDESEARRMME